MKILFLIALLTIAFIYKLRNKNNKNNVRGQNSDVISVLVDVQDFYTIEYKKYPIINTTIALNENEEKIFNALIKGVDNNYTIIVVGGWIRDKVSFTINYR